jgi:hypothetical protein
MTPQERIELETRLSALEYLFCKLNVSMLVATMPFGQIPRTLDEFVGGSGAQLFRGLDPTLSDHATAEWQNAMARLLKMQKELLADIIAQKRKLTRLGRPLPRSPQRLERISVKRDRSSL